MAKTKHRHFYRLMGSFGAHYLFGCDQCQKAYWVNRHSFWWGHS
jgi:uncharacterized protein with PIN domain